MKNINLYLIEYAVNSLFRNKSKTIFTVIVFTSLVFLLSSIFFISNSIRYELEKTVDALPQIIVQKLQAGRLELIDEDAVYQILQIKGVSDASSRVWGYYYFQTAGMNYSIVGLDKYEDEYKNSLQKLVDKFDLESKEPSMIVGSGVYNGMKKSFYKKYFNFIKPDGSLKKVYIKGVFNFETELESNDLIVMSKDLAREIFGIPKNKATDIVVTVPNPKEVFTISQKIKELFPDTRVLTKEDIKISYQNIFDYKRGIFLALFVVSLFTFFMIVYDKTNSLSGEEKKEIGILKALGWKIDDILKEKFYEGAIISIFSYTLGVLLALIFVYIFQAPLLRDVFEGYSTLRSTFRLPFVVDFGSLALIFFLSVPIYIGATIFPSWRVSVMDADEVIR
jgi:ABC-type lipoprotein release transport system permease subunit